MRLLATSSGITSTAAVQPANQERRSWLKRLGTALGLGMLAGPALAAPRGTRQVNGQDPFLGEIMLFAGTFAPRGYALCNGQLLSISQNTALFSLLGTTYGGNGQTTFALPDLQGRFPLHAGSGPSLTSHQLGQQGGSENTTLTTAQLPSHTHPLVVSSAAATSSSPAGNILAVANGRTTSNDDNVTTNAYAASGTATVNTNAIGATGSGQPVSLVNPYLALNFCIAIEGLYPSRN
jgi:microcystin-dependent protein